MSLSAAPIEDACTAATAAARDDGVLEIADVGAHATAVIDGYATLFAEIDEPFDVALVPVGVGSLAAAAVRACPHVIGVEPERAACLAAALGAGRPVAIPTPGTALAGMDCARVSDGAWPELRDGIESVITVSDAETHAAVRELHALGLRIGDCGAAPLAALRRGGFRSRRARAAHRHRGSHRPRRATRPSSASETFIVPACVGRKNVFQRSARRHLAEQPLAQRVGQRRRVPRGVVVADQPAVSLGRQARGRRAWSKAMRERRAAHLVDLARDRHLLVELHRRAVAMWHSAKMIPKPDPSGSAGRCSGRSSWM